MSATCVYTQVVKDASQKEGSIKATSRVFAPGYGIPEDPVVSILAAATGCCQDQDLRPCASRSSAWLSPVVNKAHAQTGSAWAILTGYYLGGAGRDSATALLPEGTDVSKATLDAHQLSARGGALTCTLRDGRAYIVGRGWRTANGYLENPLE